MLRLRIFLSLLASILIVACGKGGDSVGPCASGFAVRFAITEVRDSLPLDSLYLRIALGEAGPEREFQVNLKTGKSSAGIQARQGDKYTLSFALFSAGRKIGQGESQGTLKCDLNVDLDPTWSDSAVKEAKQILARGSILPPRLAESYGQAIAGKVFALPMTAADSVLYRWSAKLGDSVVVEGEGRTVSFTVPAELVGKSLLFRLMALDGEGKTLLEERKWTLQVLAAPSGDRLARIQVRTDSAAKTGSSLRFDYDGSRLARIQGFESLEPASGAAPAWAETLYYETGRIARASVKLPGGGTLDTLFGWDSTGLLRAVQVRSARDTVTDSLFHASGKLASSKRYVSGVLQETAVYRWTAADLRKDSVFSTGKGGKGLELTRIVWNRYAADSLVERTVFLGAETLLPAWRETFAYNGLGTRAWREVWTEGMSPTLERTEKYRYDASGRLAALAAKDEITGDMIFNLRYLYEGASAAKRSASGPVHASAAADPSLSAFRAAFDAAAFAHDGWRRPHPDPIPGVRP